MSTRAIDALYRRLLEAQGEFEERERMLETSRRRRNLLVTKLVSAGETTRKVGAAAKVSSSGVSQIVRRYRRGF